jgi:hypothetical protein
MLSFDGLVQDHGYIFGLEPVGLTKCHQRMGAPALLDEEVVEDYVLGPSTAFLWVLWVKNTEMQLRWKSRGLLCKVLVLRCLEAVARVWRWRWLEFCHTLNTFRDKILHTWYKYNETTNQS